MNQFNSYLHNELLNLPFDLFNLISKFIDLNENIRVAFVGGYIRDLLIQKIHLEKSSRSIDLDIVIEGSAISLAKFIKQNIVDVKVCLIKEFNLYNTVELNINDLKVDIASARQEIYLTPGSNPTVTDSSIENDLIRRDFSINAIAYEISERKIYDLFEGIKHIKAKELHLLHNKSVSDDPSRILRCAKYAARLNFNISKKTLSQSQEAIKLWPWKYDNNFKSIKFPPGIGIRIRMELLEILKHDKISKVISILSRWELLEIINKDIKLDNKFLRGLRWMKKLKGNQVLFLIKDSNSLEILCERIYINNKDRKILKDFINIKKNLEINKAEFLKFTPSQWTDFIEDKNLDIETIKLLICESGEFWRSLFRWLFIYRFIKSDKNGKLLKQEGWKSGKDLGNEIKRLRYIQIDNYSKNH